MLLAGGYLTQQGGSVLYCPSNTVNAGAPWLARPTTAGWDSPETVNKALTRIMTMDGDDPFLTTGGRSYWSDGDWDAYFGQLPFWPYQKNDYAMYTQTEWKWPAPGYATKAYWVHWDSGVHRCGRHNSIMGNYQIRPVKQDHAFVSRKLDDVAGQAVASDAIWGFYGRSRWYSGAAYNLMYGYPSPLPIDGWDNGLIFDPTGVSPWGYENATDYRPDMWVSNHDSAYNVLFSDGSVKTFADAGRAFYKWTVTKRMTTQSYKRDGSIEPGWPVSLQKTTELFETYFDPLYAQD